MSFNLISPNFTTPGNVTGLTSSLGELIVGSGPSGLTSLGVGTDGQVLTADSGEASGLIWASAGATTLQDAYDNSAGGATAEIIVDSTRGAVTVRDNGTPIGANLFEVQTNGSADVFSVTTTGATVDGKLTVTGLIDPTGLVLNEQASAPTTPAATEGLIWVDNTVSPNILRFDNGSGDSIALDTFDLQRSYNDSSDPEITLSDSLGGISIRDDTGPAVSGNLLEIQNNGRTQTYFGVDALGASIDGNLDITGNLTVQGTQTIVNTETLTTESNYLCLNKGYNANVAQRSGVVHNVDPDTGSQVAVDTGGFTAGVASTSNPTVAVDVASGTFADQDIVIITGANNTSNNGIYEVLSHSSNVLTIRGIGTSGVTAGAEYLQEDFVDDTTVAGTITLTSLTVLRARLDGQMEIGLGTATDTINSSFKTIVTEVATAGGSETLVSTTGTMGLGPTANLKGITAGTGIALSGTSTALTVSCDQTLQESYDASGSGLITLDGTRNGVVINEGGATGNLFEVQDSGSSAILEVQDGPPEVTITGKLTVTGLIDPTGLVLSEQASAPATPAGTEGLIWLDTNGANDNVLKFTDNSGTNTFDLTTVVGKSDFPSDYTGAENKILSVNGTPDAVVFSNNLTGTNSVTGGTSVAFGNNSTVGSNADSVAIGSSASAGAVDTTALGASANASATSAVALGHDSVSSATNAVAIGTSANSSAASAIALGHDSSNDTADTMTMSVVPMVNNTSANATTLGISVYPGVFSTIVTDLIDLEGSTTTYTIDLGANTRMFVHTVNVFKTEAAATVTANASYTLGSDAGNAALAPSTSVGGGSENVQFGSQVFSFFSSTVGTQTLVFDHTGSATLSAGSYNVRVAFTGMVLRVE